MPVNHILLETIQLTQNASSVVFNNIPQTGYTDLLIKFSSRETSGSQWNNLNLTFNGSGTYYSKSLVGTGSGVTSQGSSSALDRQYANGGSTTAKTFGNGEIYIPNYTGSMPKVITSNTVGESNSTSSIIGLMAGMFTSTAAITEITLNPVSTSFVTGSTFSLYGIASTGTTPVTAPKAQGGDVVANDGTYWYHAFLTSGFFTPVIPISCDTLIVAGGGGGGGTGNGVAGGGGAGGLRGLTSQSFAGSTSYSVSVGAGGTGGLPTGTYHGTNGGNSSIIGGALSLSATGGGAGGSGNGSINREGQVGGSGGGGSADYIYGTGNAGSYSPVEGYRGGTGVGYPNSSGGGGGAGAVGSPGNATRSAGGGAGGAGVNTYSTWASATSTGVSGYYAGGGSGGGYYDGATVAGGAGGGGTGGGGNSSANLPAAAGTANTGGGGGGAGNYNGFGTVYPGAAGGSGIVIIRYAMA